MGNFLKRQWPLVGIGILLGVVVFYLIRSGRDIIQDFPLKEIVAGEGLRLKDIHYSQDDPDKGLKWVLDAKEVRFSGDKSSIHFNEFRLTVEPENRSSFRLKGKRGDYSRDSGEINLWGDLEGFSGNEYRIATEHILINEKRGHLSTEKPVKIFGSFFSVTGRGLFLDLEKRRVKILSDVTAIVNEESLN